VNILVLGASSYLGAQIAMEFSPGNRLILTGRRGEPLEALASLCLARGASEARAVVNDLGAGIGPLLPASQPWPLDLIIHVACSTSRLRDHDIKWAAWQDCVLADVHHPLALVRAWLDGQPGRALTVCLVSTFLADFRSPGRVVYGALKSLHEQGLRTALAENPNLSIRIIKLGRTFSRDRATPSMAVAAKRIRSLVEESGRERVCAYGLVGKVWEALFFIQPLVFFALNKLQRSLRSAPS
jgi:NADP-dependent 3-hydroxy acid dehydrogenase YdfG